MSAGPTGRLEEQSDAWNVKPTLRAIYRDYHDRLAAACPPGRLLDIGGGSAHFKAARPDSVSLDLLPFRGIDVVADGHALPFAPGSFDGIVMLDVLHHLQRPVVFLREASRVLKVGGRLAMIEPGMSTVAQRFYDRFHHEPVDMDVDPYVEDRIMSGSDPWDSNQAIPTLMFARLRGRRRFGEIFPDLKIVSVAWLSLFAYPLSGGFKPWCLMPHRWVRPILDMEEALLPQWGRYIGYRLMVTLERTS